MISDQRIAALMMEKDCAKREAEVDALTEDEAKQALKGILHTMHRLTDGTQKYG